MENILTDGLYLYEDEQYMAFVGASDMVNELENYDDLGYNIVYFPTTVGYAVYDGEMLVARWERFLEPTF